MLNSSLRVVARDEDIAKLARHLEQEYNPLLLAHSQTARDTQLPTPTPAYRSIREQAELAGRYAEQVAGNQCGETISNAYGKNLVVLVAKTPQVRPSK